MKTIHFRPAENRLDHWRHAASSIFLQRPKYGT
jgi:hypothetical protein